MPQLVTINGINDSPPFSDGSQTVTIVTENVSSTDINFSSITNANTPKYVVMNQDDDAPGVLINVVDNNFKTSESGSTVTVLFELLSQPTGGSNVTIPLSLGVSSDEMTLSTSTISISSAHWNQPSQNQVILTGVDDSIIDGTQIVRLITGDPSSTDTPYNNLTATDVADVDLYNLDNDSAGLIITQPQAVSENESTTTFTVALQTSILTTTTLQIIVTDGTELLVDQQSLVFTSSNWKFPQTVEVTGVDDNLIDGDILSTIRLNIDTSACDSFIAASRLP